MAVRLDNTADTINTTAGLPSVTDGTFTVCGYARVVTDTGATAQRLSVGVHEGNVDLPWILSWELPDVGTNVMVLESYEDGTATYNSVAFASRPATGVDFFWAVTGVGTGANQLIGYWSSYADDTWVSASIQLASAANQSIDHIYFMDDPDTFIVNGRAANIGCWDRGLTQNELRTQKWSAFPVNPLSLNFFWPLTDSSDTRDFSGNAVAPSTSGLTTEAGPPVNDILGPIWGYWLSSGAAAISGAADFTLGALTSTATGTVRVHGAADITLGALTSTATGTVRAQGAADITLGALTVEATGEIAADDIDGAADFTLGALTTLATGTVSNAGAADITLGALTSTATGAVLVQGAADITLGALTADAEGEVAAANDGEADITLGDLVVTATGQVVVTGSVDAVLGALTVEASSSGDASSKPIRRRKKYLYTPPEELTPAEVKQLYREARQEIPVRVQGGLLTLAPDLFRNRSERELPALSRLSITKLRQEIDLLRSLQAELADIEHTRALKAEQDYEAALRRQVKKDFEDEDDAIIFAISELGP